MIEVEIRGILSKEKYSQLREFLSTNGKHVESHEREMILLTELPGYSKNLSERQVDIRLRNTSGKCEVMIKHQTSEGNTGRKEISVKLEDSPNLDAAKELAKAFGCTKGVWMHRKKEIFENNGIEWSLVEAPKEIYYFEAEIGVGDESESQEAHSQLIKAAAELKLEVLSPEETDRFIDKLNKEVNKEITL